MNGKISSLRRIVLVLSVVVSAGCAAPLIKAARKGDAPEVARLVAAGADVNQGRGQSMNMPPLLEATYNGHLDVMKVLLKNGADPDIMGGWITPLFAAALSGSVPRIRLLLDAGADIDMLGANKPPLATAAYRGHNDAVRYLLERGANVELALAYLEEEAARLGAKGKGSLATKHRLVAKLLRSASSKVSVLPVPAPPADPAAEKAFAAEAKRYRALAVKPALPEKARRFKIQAEEAIKDKRFERAIERYGQALAIAPWWPEGHFNRALILGELERYGEAIREMNRYLKLVPNAADARKAQDKIYAWEDK